MKTLFEEIWRWNTDCRRSCSSVEVTKQNSYFYYNTIIYNRYKNRSFNSMDQECYNSTVSAFSTLSKILNETKIKISIKIWLQWRVDGPRGPHGPNVTRDARKVAKNELEHVRIPPPWMVVSLAWVRLNRRWTATSPVPVSVPWIHYPAGTEWDFQGSITVR